MISYYKRWLKLTRLRSVLSVHAGGAGYDAFFIGEISASEISAILNCNILGGAGREVVGSYFVKAHKYRGPYNRFFMSLVLGDGKKKASFMEVRNAVALNRAGLGVELCGVVFLRNNLFLGGVAVVYRFLSGFTCLLGFEGGQVRELLPRVLDLMRVYSAAGFYHLDLHCENIMFSGERVVFVDYEYVVRQGESKRLLGFQAAYLYVYRSIFSVLEESEFLEYFFKVFPACEASKEFFAEYDFVKTLCASVVEDKGVFFNDYRSALVSGICMGIVDI